MSRKQLQTHRSRSSVLVKQQMIPRELVYPSSRRGTKLKGTIMTPHRNLNSKMPQPGMSKFKLSAKRTKSATHAAVSSKVKSSPMLICPFRPKATNARSEKVIRFWSTLRHLPSSCAVYPVTKADAVKNRRPTSQPAYFMPKGRLNKPTPIKTLVLLRMVWYI